jgi:hypothetical protein
MISDRQKEALKVVLELHRENKMTDEQVLTVIEALTENNPSVQYVPWTTGSPIIEPLITYKTTCRQEIK